MDVIVIGCGAAGAAAVRKLHDAGLKVLCLEAADRIGGRICTVEFGENTVDIGAAWCHGEEGNIVFELADPLGLLGRPEPHSNWYVLSDGSLVPRETSEAIISVVEGEVDNADKDNNKSISECVRNAASNEVLKANPPLAMPFIECYERLNHLGGQTDPKKGKSLRGLNKFKYCDGEFLLNWKGRGYKTILDVLLNKYPDPNKAIPVQILLNKEVENIRWGTNVGLDSNLNPLVQVKCKDGSLYAAKSVIVTISVGVLKERHNQLFNPPLPAEKIKTINHLQLSVLGKIYIEFIKPWWSITPSNFMILWREEDKANYSDGEKWITDIFALETVAHQPNLLMAWVNGNGAEIMEKLSIDAVQAGVNKLLDSVLKKKFDVTPIKSIVRSQWVSNPLFRGVYAYRSVATEENDAGGAEVLSEPLYHGDNFPVVCFAGEATSHERHTAVHGAVESGFREAERLIESFKKSKK